MDCIILLNSLFIYTLGRMQYIIAITLISNENVDSLRNEHEKYNAYNLQSGIQRDSFISL